MNNMHIHAAKILAARMDFFHAEITYKTCYSRAEEEYNYAKYQWLTFGHYDDCGPGYIRDFEHAQRVLECARKELPELITKEKYYNLLVQQFVEQWPDKQEILQEQLSNQIKDIVNGIMCAVNQIANQF